MGDEIKAPVVWATTQLIVRVNIAGADHLLSIENATVLRDALTVQLESLAKAETGQSNLQEPPDAPDQKVDGGLQAVGGADARRDA